MKKRCRIYPYCHSNMCYPTEPISLKICKCIRVQRYGSNPNISLESVPFCRNVPADPIGNINIIIALLSSIL